MNGTNKSVNLHKKIIKFNKKKLFKANIIYCPPSILIGSFINIFQKSKIKLGAQNCFYEDGHGPYTGQISSKMIKDLGCDYIILGHSESRKVGDNDKVINKKISNSLNNNLKVIFCFGETLNEYKSNISNKVIIKQISLALKNIKNKKNILFAYEPIWSIGTGKILNQKTLNKRVLFIKKLLVSKYKIKKPTIIYGGSVNSKNIKMFNNIHNLNGFLIGSSSLNVNKFIDIIKKTYN
tara:strand:- start:698 stop:1408 length:711 start_codon:yes stop_codon:yes gene_type:complete